MSARTSQASKAIRIAWNNEQELVREGKGTRDWTPKQQQDILDRGRAYDETGRAFEGHHMKCVSVYPEYQGDPNNIQFLSRDEHVKAHFNDVHNPTNGYYNYATGETIDFGDNPPVPCKRIDLSNSISITKPLKQESTASVESIRTDSTERTKEIVKPSFSIKEKFVESVGKVITKAGGFYSNHKGTIDAIGKLAAIATPIIVSELGKSKRIDSTPTTKYNNSESIQSNDSIEHSNHASPNEHEVRAHSQRYHTKEGIITREKKAYPRGGNKE